MTTLSTSEPQKRKPKRDGATYWGTMVIWTKQMKRKTREAHAT
jgi:hypothetical protein